MSVAKVLNLVGSSTKSWEDAVEQTIEEASKTIRNITGAEVMNTTAVIKDNKIVEYKANVNVAFKVENDD